jgi:hypothetical protein
VRRRKPSSLYTAQSMPKPPVRLPIDLRVEIQESGCSDDVRKQAGTRAVGAPLRADVGVTSQVRTSSGLVSDGEGKRRYQRREAIARRGILLLSAGLVFRGTVATYMSKLQANPHARFVPGV